MSGRSTA